MLRGSCIEVDVLSTVVDQEMPALRAGDQGDAQFLRELKTNLSIAVGCTGGRHRSVYVAERLAALLKEAEYDAVVHHRDKDRWRY